MPGIAVDRPSGRVPRVIHTRNRWGIPFAPMDLNSIWLSVLALGAALINGGIGYGFSSIVTPIAIFWYSNKVLNPSLVTVEVAVNIALLVRERRFIPATWPRARPLLTTLLPGIVLGTLGLTYLEVNDVKLVVYAALLPLVSLQLLGISRPFKNEARGSAAVGPGIGFLYALTTISGPPLALFLRNQGLTKDEFRCTIAQIRVAESTLTLGTYILFTGFFNANLISIPSLGLIPYLLVPVLIGVPIGTLSLTKVSPEFFRRFVMAVDSVFLSYGFSRILVTLRVLSSTSGYLLMVLMFAAVGVLAWIALRGISTSERAPPSVQPQPDPGGQARPGDSDAG